MTEENKKNKHLSCLNPLSWMRGLYVSILSVFAVISHYFVFLLVILLIGLLSFFAYDRYMFYTYGPDGQYKGPFQSKSAPKEDTPQYTYAEEKIVVTETTEETHETSKEKPESSLRPIRSSIQEEVNRRLGKTTKNK